MVHLETDDLAAGADAGEFAWWHILRHPGAVTVVSDAEGEAGSGQRDRERIRPPVGIGMFRLNFAPPWPLRLSAP